MTGEARVEEVTRPFSYITGRMYTLVVVRYHTISDEGRLRPSSSCCSLMDDNRFGLRFHF